MRPDPSGKSLGSVFLFDPLAQVATVSRQFMHFFSFHFHDAAIVCYPIPGSWLLISLMGLPLGRALPATRALAERCISAGWTTWALRKPVPHYPHNQATMESERASLESCLPGDND